MISFWKRNTIYNLIKILLLQFTHLYDWLSIPYFTCQIKLSSSSFHMWIIYEYTCFMYVLFMLIYCLHYVKIRTESALLHSNPKLTKP
jgi:hypothetical protein